MFGFISLTNKLKDKIYELRKLLNPKTLSFSFFFGLDLGLVV